MAGWGFVAMLAGFWAGMLALAPERFLSDAWRTDNQTFLWGCIPVGIGFAYFLGPHFATHSLGVDQAETGTGTTTSEYVSCFDLLCCVWAASQVGSRKDESCRCLLIHSVVDCIRPSVRPPVDHFSSGCIVVRFA